jgi:small-conductance mechanosensitive channel
VYIPNNIVAQALIINYHRAKEHTRKIQFDVDVKVPFNRLESIIDRVMKDNKIEAFNVKLEYLHQLFYVVTVHVKVQEKDVKNLKSEIFGHIIDELNAEHSAAQKRLNAEEKAARGKPA